MMKPKDFPIANLRLDGGTQPRADMSQFTVDDYAASMSDGETFPAITVFHDGDAYWLADGFHRVAAAQQAGIETLKAIIKKGARSNRRGAEQELAVIVSEMELKRGLRRIKKIAFGKMCNEYLELGRTESRGPQRVPSRRLIEVEYSRIGSVRVAR